jgi:ABC-type glycerol-3-phosphate transport system substrate-binding protein
MATLRTLRSALGVLETFALGLIAASCGQADANQGTVITFAGSALGAEGALLQRQIDRFMRVNPGVRVRIQRTPDDATQRHQLFVQWLNARAGDPDVLQLDVVWTAEFAAAEWIAPLTRWKPNAAEFFPATVAANTWAGQLYAIPWFMDVGMLYWRTDLMPSAPSSLEELASIAKAARARTSGPRDGFVWQGARYEGLVTGFLEILVAYGGRILTDDGRVVVDSPEAVRALTFMRDLVSSGASPNEVLTWHEEESRFAFQNGNAAFMRNWPYAFTLMNTPRDSRVAGKFSVAPMPGAQGGTSAATLGGAPLAINAYSDHLDASWALIAFLTAPEQMLERAQLGGYPTRPAVYDDPRLANLLPIPVAAAREIVARSVARPAMPIYSQLSDLLQIQLHRSLTGQIAPSQALREAARQMNALIERTRVREMLARGGRPNS